LAVCCQQAIAGVGLKECSSGEAGNPTTHDLGVLFSYPIRRKRVDTM